MLDDYNLFEIITKKYSFDADHFTGQYGCWVTARDLAAQLGINPVTQRITRKINRILLQSVKNKENIKISRGYRMYYIKPM